MKRRILATVLSVVVCLAEQPAGASDATPKVTLREKASITVEAQPPVSPQEAARIKQLIHHLTNVDRPYPGLSGSASGVAFAPVPESDYWTSAVDNIPGPAEAAEDVVALVKLGPSALPFLLEALDDQTPTKLKIELLDGGVLGNMRFASELGGNPANEQERRVIEMRSRLFYGPGIGASAVNNGPYNVKVGDVCFVIIGQIVNRPYEAVRNQPSGSIVVNSPTHDPILAKEVREIWSATNPAQYLVDSLLTDFVTEKIEGPSEDVGRYPYKWIRPGHLQCGAARRLLYFFPKQSVNMIAGQLSRLDESKATEDSDWPASTADLIKAVGWSDNPEIRRKIATIFEQTTNGDALLASAKMVAPDAVQLRKRMEAVISSLPNSEKSPSPYGNGFALLHEFIEKYGADTKPVLIRSLRKASTQRCETMCDLLWSPDIKGEWFIDVLALLLDDKRPVVGQYHSDWAGKSGAPLPYRVCDLAANVITSKFPKTTFNYSGSYDDLDLQIKKMREQIDKKDY